MPPDRSSLGRFVEKLPELFAADTITIEKLNSPRNTGTDWDTPARQQMKQKFGAWLKQELGLDTDDVKETLFVEGLFGDLPAGTRGEFFGSVCCPDLALKSNDEYTIAVELDHGSSGARLRNALTKASFNVILGGFNRSIVLFFVDLKDRKQRETKFNSKHEILKLFEDKFATTVFFITNYELSP
jgi:hypothetical protein